ncbi:GntR family transcriptional regulator [Kitasatospora sp. NPDC091335]|uniref:GntR family transcriptional regulator n=1 Tax=Kitasatospora sp. NPDC091335 TaxID=3364085 RepID=UPI0038026F1E
MRPAGGRGGLPGTVVAGAGLGPVTGLLGVDGGFLAVPALVEVGAVQRSVVRALDRRADGVIAARLGLEESTPLVYLERVRLADEEPLAVDRTWFPADVAHPLLDVDFTPTSLYDELERHCGSRIYGGWERIRAVVPGRGERILLDCPETTALLAIDRLGHDADGRPVEWRQTLVRADRFAVAAAFSAHDYRLGASVRTP